MFSDHSPCCPYLWNLSSRVPICLHPRLHGGASTSHFWSAGPGLFAALCAAWAVSLLEKPFSEELLPRLALCSIPTGLYYQTHSLCLPDSMQGVPRGPSQQIDPMDTHPSHEPKSLHQLPHLSKRSKAWNSCARGSKNWALHALRVQSPLVKGLGREHLLGDLEEGGLPGNLCHEDKPFWLWARLCALLIQPATLGAVSAAGAQTTKGRGDYSCCWKFGT